MKTIVRIMFLFFIVPSGYSQVDIYDAYTLPDSLIRNAHSVKREEKIEFEIKDFDQATLTIHRVYTVLDKEGDDVLMFVEQSDGFRKLEDAEIKVYNAHGGLVNKYKMKEMNSQANGEGLVPDGKVYYLRVATPSYPVTVQYDFQKKYKGTLNYPDYRIEEPYQSVEHSTYTLIVPSSMDIRYKAQNITLSPVINNNGKKKIYTWEVAHLNAIPYEEGSVSYESNFPAILLAPNKFTMDGYDGDLSSWTNFGKWYAQLAKGSTALSETTIAFLKNMVKDAHTENEKIKILYNYLQNNFRYVSIQLGIGGFKPFDAEFVDSKKYGDCKALTNYMQAMLEAVGIISYPALINGGYNKKPVDPAFPHNSFNHVILCVPGNKDTTWLECTSNISDAGILGSFTENRNALLITPSGGVLVPTPESKPSENILDLRSDITFNDDGSGESKSILKAKGQYKEEIKQFIADENKDDQKKYLVRRLGFLQPDGLLVNCNKENDSVRTTIKLSLAKVPQFTAGDKMFLNPRIYKILNENIPNDLIEIDDSARSRPYYLRYPFIKTDTTVYHLPGDYTVDNLPAAVDLHYEYGTFSSNYKYDEKTNTITSTAYLKTNQQIIPAKKYIEAKNFFGGVIKEYTEKIVVRKKIDSTTHL